MQLSAPTQIFVLRCWQVQGQDGGRWRFRVEVVATGEVRHFACWAEVVAFLCQYLGFPPKSPISWTEPTFSS